MIKKPKYILPGFTLVEIMIVITIIAILAVGVSNINWNRLTDRQKITIFTNRVSSDIETIRNNALFGKGIGTDLIVPDRWKIDISTVGVDFLYQTGSNDFVSYDNVEIGNQEAIAAVYCGNTLISETGSILIEGINMSLLGAAECEDVKTISMDLTYRSFTGTIEINSVSGLISNTQ